MLDLKRLIAKMLTRTNELSKAYVVEEGTSGVWTYKKWSTGRCEAFANLTGAAAEGSAWGTYLYYIDRTFSVPNGLFASVTHRLVTSNHSQWTAYACWGSATSLTIRLTKPNKNSQAQAMTAYLVGTWK